MMEINPQHINLDSLFSNRLFRIPQYQRAYSWRSKQRNDLFEDIKKSYAAGQRNHFMATIVGMRRDKPTVISTSEHQVVEIVDGQQRITTLILLLKAISDALPSEEKTRKDLEEMLVKGDSATLLLLQTNHDSSGYFADYIRDGKHPRPSEAETLADRRLLRAIRECRDFVKKWQREGHPLIELVVHLKNRLTFIFHEIGDEALVYSVFEVLNSRGLEVSWFDRLKSMLMAVVFESGTGNEYETIDEVHQLWADIYKTVGLRLGLSTESLRFAATLRSEDQPSRVLNPEDAANALRGQAQTVAQVIETTKWILSVTKAVDTLRADQRKSAVTQVLNARLVAVAVNLREDFSETEKDRILRRWENVTFRIFGIYGKDARTAVGAYVRLAWNIWQKELSAEQILSCLSRIGSKYPCNEESVSAELSEVNAYGERFTLEELRYLFHRYEEYLAREAGQKFCNQHWNHIWQARPIDSVEHILPQSSKKEYIHWLGNLTILPPKLNSTLQDKPPSKKATAYTKTGLRDSGSVAERINKQRINKQGKWCKEEVLERERELIAWAAREWSD